MTSKLMTDATALCEARKRWGEFAFAERYEGERSGWFPEKHSLTVGYYEPYLTKFLWWNRTKYRKVSMGWSSDYHWKNTMWEHAFLDADKTDKLRAGIVEAYNDGN